MRPQLVLISGLSGSGKSSAANCFEDLGYYCIDNLPLPLFRQFLENPVAAVGAERKIAVVVDVRAPGFASEMPALLRSLDRRKLDLVLLFLEATDEALLRRFSETRRPHPLDGTNEDLPAQERTAATSEDLQGSGPASSELPIGRAIETERALLDELRSMADLVLDTSSLNIHEIRHKLWHAFRSEEAEAPGMQVSLVSFGFKYGVPLASDLLFDVRFLPNPHFDPDLRPLSGRDAAVREFLEEQSEFGELRDRLAQLLEYLLPRYRREHRSYLSVAIGCTGGRHRSVALCEALRERLSSVDPRIHLEHRDLERGG